jgi:altronate dehydratase large subunit
MSEIKIKGYKRNNSSFGIRNHLIVMSSVCCANSIVEQVALLDDDVIPITHQHGCNHLGEDRTQVLNTLVGICNNANVGGILLIGLGCENITEEDISKEIKCENKIVRKFKA